MKNHITLGESRDQTRHLSDDHVVLVEAAGAYRTVEKIEVGSSTDLYRLLDPREEEKYLGFEVFFKKLDPDETNIDDDAVVLVARVGGSDSLGQ